jgi:hypothetical protein
MRSPVILRVRAFAAGGCESGGGESNGLTPVGIIYLCVSPQKRQATHTSKKKPVDNHERLVSSGGTSNPHFEFWHAKAPWWSQWFPTMMCAGGACCGGQTDNSSQTLTSKMWKGAKRTSRHSWLLANNMASSHVVEKDALRN